MDQLQTRLDALEQQMSTVTRRLRWWRGLAGGLLVLAVFTWALPAGTAPEAQKKKKLEERVAALEDLLQPFSRDGNEVFITGANLHIVNGLEDTTTANGAGNLIVGYNELRPVGGDVRTGSHNIVVGWQNNFSSSGGAVIGAGNSITEDFASVFGGSGNVASGLGSTVCGGLFNIASGIESVVSGGQVNEAAGIRSSISGGNSNIASGFSSSVSGGLERTAEEEFDWVAGSLFEDE
jgi:hypothetical protein